MTLKGLFSHPCSQCGIAGLHACPGKPIPPMTEERKKELLDALDRVFGKEKRQP